MAFLLIVVAAGLWARPHGAQRAQQVMTKSMAKEGFKRKLESKRERFQESVLSI